VKILITGGSGYFGTELNKYLSEKGYEVWSYDVGFFKDNWLGSPLHLNEKWVNVGNLTEIDIKQFDSVINFAGVSNDPVKQLGEDEMHKSSIKYSFEIAKICKRLNIPFIFASSCSVYGFSTKMVDENSTPNPLTPYSQAKLDIEMLLQRLSDNDWQPLILRFATIFGFSPRMRFDTVINMFCGMAIANRKITLNSNGEALRPFLYLRDACEIIEFFLQPKIDLSGLLASDNKLIVNVGRSRDNYSINQVVENIIKLTDVKNVEYINDHAQKTEVFADNKIVNGVDKRSYKVSFDKLFNFYDQGLKHNNFTENINKTLVDLNYLNLSAEAFTSNKFYRLQFLENLIEQKIINKNLEFNVTR
jgi:nucleoside-diphosphate-sugar epimerase